MRVVMEFPRGTLGVLTGVLKWGALGVLEGVLEGYYRALSAEYRAMPRAPKAAAQRDARRGTQRGTQDYTEGTQSVLRGYSGDSLGLRGARWGTPSRVYTHEYSLRSSAFVRS
jgi:hypothetical protein